MKNNILNDARVILEHSEDPFLREELVSLFSDLATNLFYIDLLLKRLFEVELKAIMLPRLLQVLRTRIDLLAML